MEGIAVQRTLTRKATAGTCAARRLETRKMVSCLVVVVEVVVAAAAASCRSWSVDWKSDLLTRKPLMMGIG